MSTRTNRSPRHAIAEADLAYEDDDDDEEEALRVSGSLPSHRLDAVVKLFVTHTEPNYSLPWQMRRQTSSTSSGFIMDARLSGSRSGSTRYILTNARGSGRHRI